VQGYGGGIPTHLRAGNLRKNHCEIRFRETPLVPNMSTSLQITLAAEMHLTERKIYLKRRH
jgi:hypothetical protein